ncbi:MAG TPA: maleylpyruvate isomerase N-terminal domain-containing protein [Nocardioidaceae bacterium]|nr:maleylpyruvate isomerase N-terminal domain-containing protein [Nocardioidaceae bacterium]
MADERAFGYTFEMLGYGRMVGDAGGDACTFRQERSDLLALLDELSPRQWAAPSAAGGWTVKDIVLHLLDGDLGRLSRGRDGDLTGQLRVERSDSLANALAAKNDRWIQATRQFSPRVIRDLLLHSTGQIDEWTSQADTLKPAHVSWASDDPVPTWLDFGREFTETWVHHQRVREATGHSSSTARLPDALGIFVWAFQHQYRSRRRPGWWWALTTSTPEASGSSCPRGHLGGACAQGQRHSRRRR